MDPGPSVCVACRYTLGDEIDVAQPCPECGTPRRPLDEPFHLRHADPAYLGALRVGTQIVAGAVVLFITGALAMLGFVLTAVAAPAASVAPVLGTTYSIAFALGFLLLFAGHAALSAAEFPRLPIDRPRLLFRISASLCVLLVPAAILANAVYVPHRFALPVLVTCALLALAALMITSLMFLTPLARRAGAERTSIRSAHPVTVVLVFGLFAAAVWVVPHAGAGVLALPLLITITTARPAMALRRQLRTLPRA